MGAKLSTQEAFLKVTSTHRMVVPDKEGRPCDVKDACDLKRGDWVFCGTRAQRLVKDPVVRQERNRPIEITFEPDDGVESFMAPKWSLVSKGSVRYDTDD